MVRRPNLSAATEVIVKSFRRQTKFMGATETLKFQEFWTLVKRPKNITDGDVVRRPKFIGATETLNFKSFER